MLTGTEKQIAWAEQIIEDWKATLEILRPLLTRKDTVEKRGDREIKHFPLTLEEETAKENARKVFTKETFLPIEEKNKEPLEKAIKLIEAALENEKESKFWINHRI